MQKVKIGTVLFEQAKGAAVVTLQEEVGERSLPIVIGLWEGMAIFRELNRTPSHRPMLHDLFYHILCGFQARLEKIVVDAAGDNTYYARLYIGQGQSTMLVDARPSDALALALRFQAPIYVADAVLEAAGKQHDFAVSEESTSASTPSEDIQAWLENIRPEDFADPQ